ncbi:MAG: ATP-binding protein, partial [bacterium]
IYRDKAGTLWVGTQRGLNKFDEQSEKFKPYNYSAENPAGLSGDFVLSIWESRYGGTNMLWLATRNGLNGFDPATEQFTHFFHNPRNLQSLSHNTINCLYQDRKGRLWIGTASGLNRLIWPSPAFLDKNFMGNASKLPTPESATFIHYSTKDGLPHYVINGILEDEAGHLWVSTNRGISKFDPEREGFRNYDVTDGLQNSEFNRGAYYRSPAPRDEMFFGGISGLNMFFPQALQDNPHLPPVVLTDFKLFNKSVGLSTAGETALQKVIAETDEIHLSYKDNVFSFEFAALEYTAPEKNQYAYKMEGFDRDWLYAGAKREAVYTNLAPGEYTFRVKASNNDGVWNEQGASVKVIIAPPFWRTWWAYTLYILFITGLLYGITRYELNRMRLKAQLKLRHLEAEKLKELDALKSHFFSNISHEFRTPLTLILGPIEKLLAGTKDKNAEQDLNLMRNNAANLLRLINQLLDLAKLESGKMRLQASQGDLIQCLRTMTAAFESLAKIRNIALHFHAPVASLTAWFNRDQMEKVFSNLLSNAIKFTPDGGSVEVAVSSNSQHTLPLPSATATSPANFVEITVKDTGIGVLPDKLPHVFDRFYQAESASTRKFEGTGIGLSLVKELVELHYGSVEITSEEGRGTEVVVRLPLGKAHLSEDEIVEVEASDPYSVIRDPARGTWQVASEQDVVTPLIQPSIDPAIQDQDIILNRR